VLLLNKEADHPDYDSLEAIDQAVKRAADLVRQLLLFSRKSEIQKKPVHLNQEVNQACRMLERTIPRMIEIEVRPGSRLWTVHADPVQIEQTILNLGGNAADAMPDGGRLLIETQNVVLDDDYVDGRLEAEPGRYVLLTVSDTGEGMDKETVEHIFDPFFTTKGVGRGTGLGLSSVYGIVKSHGGYINCYSEKGQGTSFKIYLPAGEEAAEEDAEAPAASPALGGDETILLVDDDELIRDFASQALAKFGYTVLTAVNGEEAVEIYSEKGDAVDLVIMDIGMPGMGGRQCLGELLRLDPDARILIASGYALNGQVKQTFEEGAADYVGKPYQLGQLLQKVRGVLDRN
jgi:CheY-like chemotaxis protein